MGENAGKAVAHYKGSTKPTEEKEHGDSQQLAQGPDEVKISKHTSAEAQ